MPQVPLMVVPSVSQSQLPGARIEAGDPTNAAGNMASGLMRSGQQFDAIAAQQQATLNEASVKDAHAQATDAVSKILYDPETGYMNQRGKNAVDTFDAAKSAIESSLTDINGKMTNPEQQRLFRQVAQQTAIAATSEMRRHAAQQNNVYEIDASNARAEAGGELARKAYNPLPGADNSLYDQGVRTQLLELDNQAEKLGITGDEKLYDAFIRKGMSKTYTGVISDLLENKQTKAAKDFFADVRDNLDPDVADKVGHILKTAATQDDALGLALEVKGQAKGIAEQEATLDKKFKDGEITAEVHGMALQHLRADNAQRRGEEAETDKSVLGQIWAMHNKNPGLTTSQLPVGLLSYVQTRGLGQHVDSILRPEAAGGEKVDDTRAFVQLMHMAADDPVGFANTDLFKLGLTNAHIMHFAAMQGSVDKKDATSQSVNKLMSNTVRMAVGELKAAGINPGAKAGTTGAEDYAEFQNAAFEALADAVQVRHASKLQPMSDEDARGIVLGVIKKEALGGTGFLGAFKTEGPAFKVMSKIPQADRDQITEALRKKGLPVTPAAIVELYNKHHQ